jgi:uncharacterized cupin superfamily protein
MPTNGLSRSVYSDDDLEPSAPSEDGAAHSYYTVFPDPAALDPGVDMFVWVAEPGTYAHEVAPVAESSIIVEGSAQVEVEGHGTFDLSPGTLMSIPPGVPGLVTVRERLRALVIAARQ